MKSEVFRVERVRVSDADEITGAAPSGAALGTTQRHKSSLANSWFTITSLVSKDFKLKYRRSVLGVLWSVLNPLLMMCVLTAVFSTFFKFDIQNFPLYLILGQTLFTFMSDATTAAMKSIIDSSALIKKVRINKLVFPIEQVLFQLVNFAISLIAVAFVVAFFQVIPGIYLLLLPLLVAFVFLFSLGLGLLLSSLAVFFRDMVHLWGVITMAWMYATPLFYPIEILPGWMLSAEVFNPMYHYVAYFRDIVMYNVCPDLLENLICFGFAAITFVVGFVVFKATERKFILYV